MRRQHSWHAATATPPWGVGVGLALRLRVPIRTPVAMAPTPNGHLRPNHGNPRTTPKGERGAGLRWSVVPPAGFEPATHGLGRYRTGSTRHDLWPFGMT